MDYRILGLIGFILIIFLPFLAGVYTDYLWFQELNYTTVFLTILSTKLIIFFSGSAFFFVFLYLNLRYALHKLHKTVGRGIVIFLIVASLFTGLISMSGWETVLKYFNQASFKLADPIFNNNLSFYIFSLPFFWFIWRIVFSTMIMTAIVTTFIYFYNFIAQSMRRQESGFERRVKPMIFKSRKALLHISLLVGTIFILIGIAFFFNRFSILTSTLGVVSGVGYTDLTISLPRITVLSALSFIAGIVFFVSPLIRKFKLSLYFVIILVAAAVVGGMVSFVTQQYIVVPDEYNRETSYLEYNIKYTRLAYDLENIKELEFPVEYELTMDDIKKNNQTIENIRLWDWRPLIRTYKQVQLIRTYYDFYDADIDRYTINGEYKQVIMSGREINKDLLPEKTWVNNHLVFTHGYGVTMSPVREVTKEGLPSLLIKDIPPVSEKFNISRPEIYYGELTNDFIITNSLTEELDYPKGEVNVYTTYEGSGGVKLSSMLRKLAMALRFNSIEILLSESVTPESKILFNRNIVERVSTIAPFLALDRDPYLVTDAGKLYWIIDAYTVSDKYPYSEMYSRINYIRNPVKIVIDAYNGDTKFYVIEEEPIIETYRNIFPEMFRSFDEMSEGLKKHIRYPIDLFDIQAEVYKKYHMKDSRVFYNQEDLWETPQQLLERDIIEMEPYYLIMKLPGEKSEEFILLKPFTPKTKNNIIGWMSARSDFPNYGERIVFMFPKDKLVYGPMQIEARIDQNPEISQLFTLWSQVGTRVIRGEMLVIPIEDSILYVEPIYLRAEQAGALPEMKRIIVAFGDKLTMQETLDGALEVIFGKVKEVVKETGEVETVEKLIAEALQHYNQAQEFLKQGDWEGYGREQQKLKEALEELGKRT